MGLGMQDSAAFIQPMMPVSGTTQKVADWGSRDGGEGWAGRPLTSSEHILPKWYIFNNFKVIRLYNDR